MKTSTVGRDWVDDLFEKVEQEVDEEFVFRLLDLVETALLEPRDAEEFEDAILREDLTNNQAVELLRMLLDVQPRVPDMYAPSQTQLSKWIRSFCFTRQPWTWPLDVLFFLGPWPILLLCRSRSLRTSCPS